MKRAGIVVGAVLLLALAGCTQSPQGDAEAPNTAESTAPLVAESPSAQAGAEDASAAFLAQVRETLPDTTSIPNATDEQLLAAGEEACQRMAAGEDGNAMSVIEGEQPTVIGSYNDSGPIIRAADAYLCS